MNLTLKKPSLGPLTLLNIFLFAVILLSLNAVAQQAGGGGTCSDAIPCKVGCCSSSGQCGFTPEHCGDGCKSNCNATAECGQYAREGEKDCPINVCCSQWGFCGTTDGFCGDGCQPNSKGGGCGDAPRPGSCGSNTDVLKMERRIGYYELFNVEHACNVFEPEDLLVAGLTHMNLAFVNFGEDFKLNSGYGSLIYRSVLLKINNPGLHVSIAVGGWTFNDPPTATYWSDMASTYPNRQTFINSVVDFLKKYGLDGIDLDWEYPKADDRGGKPEDTDNYVLLVSELREAFDAENPAWTITVTLPTSYWYLRGFDVERMQKYVSWFNLMSYDLHGMWDHDNTWTGPWLKGHTDIKEIDQGLDLLWRNNVKPENVVFGMAFYGRSFTMADPNCHEPNGVCQFSTGGMAGSCSNTIGVLTYQEITARNTTLDVQTYYNAETTVKYNVFNGNQWISYDDAQSWLDKKAFVSDRCLSGIMVWALDQDNATFDAYEGLMGDTSLLQLEGGGLSDDEKGKLADQFAAYTGQNCFVTPRCTDGSPGQQGSDQVCPGGFQSVSTAHTPKQAPGHDYAGECSQGWYRHICCPKDAMPKNCAWNGAPERSAFGCDGECGSSQFKLNEDSALDAKGKGSCYTGTRALCCDSTALVSDCYWTGCQGPLAPGSNPTCDSGYTFEAFRLDKPDGSRWCSDTYVSPVGGTKGSPLHDRFKSALCCPKKEAFSNCHWSNDLQPDDGPVTTDAERVCLPQQCGKGKIKLADALDPPVSPMVDPSQQYPVSCDSVSAPPGLDMHFPLCCDVQSKYNRKWPVDPEKLYEIYYNDPESSDVLWQYSDEVTNNDKDDTRSDEEDGTDAFGFLMLDGPQGSIDNSFATTQTVVRREAKIPNIKRSLVTNNQTVLDQVFEHSEEVIHVYCNFPAGSPECERIWIDGAEDTIIRLPDHVGEGPFARIVSMTLAEDTTLPEHHLEHRTADGIHENPVYEVKIDYNFLAITPKRADQPVMLRVDYTNLLGYWDEVTAADSSKMKRDADGKTMPDWHSRVRRAVMRDTTLRKRSEPINITAPMDPIFAGNSDVADENGVEKRWWGAIGAWIKKLTTVEKSELGVIPLGWSDSINLFRAQWGCPGQTFSANLRMDLEAEIQMDATYAYYLSGTFIPPSKPEVYAYLGMEPSAYVGLRMVGNAIMQTTTGRKKIIDTLAYPGLAVKGIAAVGPTLDVYGEIRGKVTLHGEASAGAQLNFGKAEVYWPTEESASQELQKLVGLDSKSNVPAPDTIAPTFEAGVAIDAGLDIIVTPEASIGVKIGGGSLVGGVTIMDAQLTGYVTGDLSFQAHGDADVSSGKFRYSYGVYAFYNLGYKVTAVIAGLVNWGTGPIQAYTPSKRINVYGPISGEISLTKRDLDGFLLDGEADWHTSNGTMSLLPRADDEGDVTPNDPEFTQNLQCPAGSSGDVKIPELRFNCDAFGPTQVLPTALTRKSRLVPGMCDGWNSMTQRPTTLTYSADGVRNDQRRGQQCPSKFCKDAMDTLQYVTGRSPPLECDEAPWASSEEGGDFYPDKISRSQTCVPSYQNGGWAGSSCQKMVRDLQTNWGQLDPAVPADQRTDNWVPWTSDLWTKDQLPQRDAMYPNRMPPPDGMSTRTSDQISWYFRRNYTWSVVDFSDQASTWWDATGKSYANARYNAARYAGPSGYDGILCALNTFGDKYFRIAGNKYNGYCMRGPLFSSKGWDAVYHAAQCKITFGTTTKRSVDGEENWEVLDVQFVDDPDEIEEEIIVELPSNYTGPIDGAGIEHSHLSIPESSPGSKETHTLLQPASAPAVDSSSRSESGGDETSTSSNSPIGTPMLGDSLIRNSRRDSGISIEGLEDGDGLDKLAGLSK